MGEIFLVENSSLYGMGKKNYSPMERINTDTMKMLKGSGAWRPIEWTFGWKKHSYILYSTFIIVVLGTYLLSQFVFILQSMNETIEEITSTLFIFCTTVSVVCKYINILIKRDNIIEIVGMLSENFCTPENQAEIEIQQKFNKKIRFFNIIFESLSSMAITSVALGSFLSKELPFNGWVPFEYKELSVAFWCIYTHQVYAHGVGAVIGTAFDLFFCNLLNLACSQFRILKHRLRHLATILANESQKETHESIDFLESSLLKKIVRHHLHILRFTRCVNELFGAVVLLQCTVSTFVLCASTYLMTKIVPFSSEFTFLVIYVSGMSFEIFFYCWHGNEVMCESMTVNDALYDMDWYLLSSAAQKKLIIIMILSVRPIQFKTASIITLSLETYTSLLKLSYSIYNLLQTTESSDPQ